MEMMVQKFTDERSLVHLLPQFFVSFPPKVTCPPGVGVFVGVLKSARRRLAREHTEEATHPLSQSVTSWFPPTPSSTDDSALELLSSGALRNASGKTPSLAQAGFSG